MNWDDVRFFLAVAQHGSVRAAAARLRVNHSTVLRRISQLERQLGARLFEKLPSGYQLTDAGAEIFDLAEQMEATSTLLETRVFGRDQTVSGPLRVTLAPSLVTNLLLPDLADFSARHPEIQLEILTSHETLNLTNRQADVALRLAYDRSTLPEHLFGIRLQEVFRSVYVAPRLLDRDRRPTAAAAVKWILKAEDGAPPEWAQTPLAPDREAVLKVTDLQIQHAAAKAGMGVAILPCFIGDTDSDLVRVPDVGIQRYGTLWLLTHGETRRTKRVRLFSDYIRERLARHAARLQGLPATPER